MSYKIDSSMDNIINFSAYMREEWIASKAAKLFSGATVLDAGAGQCPYRKYFTHCDYKTQDFAQYEGTSTGSQVEDWNYGKLDYVCNITDIPVPDNSFDLVLCTEVLEHLPYPIEALRELARITKSGGTILLTAPLGCGLHQQPYHFYGGFTPHFYNKVLGELGFSITEIKPIGGVMRHVGQEAHRVGRIILERAPQKLPFIAKYFLMNWLPRFLNKIDDEVFVEEFTVGYVVEAVKGRT